MYKECAVVNSSNTEKYEVQNAYRPTVTAQKKRKEEMHQASMLIGLHQFLKCSGMNILFLYHNCNALDVLRHRLVDQLNHYF